MYGGNFYSNHNIHLPSPCRLEPISQLKNIFNPIIKISQDFHSFKLVLRLKSVSEIQGTLLILSGQHCRIKKKSICLQHTMPQYVYCYSKMYTFRYSEKNIDQKIQNSSREYLKFCNSLSLMTRGLKISSFSTLLYGTHFSLGYNPTNLLGRYPMGPTQPSINFMASLSRLCRHP